MIYRREHPASKDLPTHLTKSGEPAHVAATVSTQDSYWTSTTGHDGQHCSGGGDGSLWLATRTDDDTLSHTPQPPSAPTGLHLKAGKTRITATWKAPEHPVAGPVLGYRVFADTQDAVKLPGSTLTFVMSGLEPGSEHGVQIVAIGAGGQGPVTAASMTLPETRTKKRASTPTNLPQASGPTLAAAPVQSPASSSAAAKPVDPVHSPPAGNAYVAPQVIEAAFDGCTRIADSPSGVTFHAHFVLVGGQIGK
jgi:hypothetical protein